MAKKKISSVGVGIVIPPMPPIMSGVVITRNFLMTVHHYPLNERNYWRAVGMQRYLLNLAQPEPVAEKEMER